MEELNKQFPQIKAIRLDSDTTRNKGSYREIITEFAQGKADLLVGTQMLTKGLDLPQVTLVGVVTADGLLNMSDYRSSERTFQTLTQVAGRCGRGEELGEVIIQTYTPEHRVIKSVIHHDYHGFIQDELPERNLLKYPPYGQIILLKFSGKDEKVVELVVDRIAQELHQLLADYNLEILGPAPAAILRIADRFRWQIMLKFADQQSNNIPDLNQLHQLCPHDVRMTIDIDPLNFY
jgi:primosomal protein N' (replication factor Y)